MTDTGKAWIEERRAIIHDAREAIRPAEAIDLGLIDLPRALDALNAVLEVAARDDLHSYRKIMSDGYPSVVIRDNAEIAKMFTDAIESALEAGE